MRAGCRSTTPCAGRFLSTAGVPPRKQRARWEAVFWKSGLHGPVVRRLQCQHGDYRHRHLRTNGRAGARAAFERSLSYVKELTVMDAAALTFPDGTFDCVVGQFVITLVENPERSPRDLIGATAVGCLDEDLRNACLAALACERAACREFAIGMSWERSARAFVEHVTTAAAARQLAA